MTIKEKLILLETIENLRKLNPWKINLTEELTKIYNLLKEYFNLIIAGIAVDNAAYIYNKKIDEIEKIIKYRDTNKNYRDTTFNDVVIPPVEIQYNPQKYMLDISELLEQLNELLEKEISKKMERNVIEVDVTDLRRFLEERLKEAREFILNILHLEKAPVLFTDLCKVASKRGIDPLYILYAILFLAQEEIIDIELMESDDYVEEIIIRKEN